MKRKKKRAKVKVRKVQEVKPDTHVIELEVLHGPPPSSWARFAKWLESIWQ